MIKKIISILWSIQELPNNIKSMYQARKGGTMIDVLYILWNVDFLQVIHSKET